MKGRVFIGCLLVVNNKKQKHKRLCHVVRPVSFEIIDDNQRLAAPLILWLLIKPNLNEGITNIKKLSDLEGRFSIAA